MNHSASLQTVVCVDVKIVPATDPNADGEWITLTLNESHVRPTTRWSYLTSLAPVGMHVVAARNVR